MRLGVFGGTFDPIHYGHLLLAERCREQCRLDEVWFLPALSPPHKTDDAVTPADKRLEMARLAIAGHPHFIASALEIERGGVSYTWRTLEQIHRQEPQAELFFLLGADSLADFPQWREPAKICELATPIVYRRRGYPEPDFQPLSSWVSPRRFQQIVDSQAVDLPLIELSSTEIREAVAAGQSVRYQLPRAVEKYIETQGLYRRSGT